MDKIKEDLKSMQLHPKLHIANYFTDLKQDVDLKFIRKEDEKAKYLEIINKIESFEQEWFKIKPFNTFDHEIEALRENDFQSQDDLRYKIEKKLFQNKSKKYNFN